MVASSREGASDLYYRGGEAENGALFVGVGKSVDLGTFFSAVDAQLLLEKTTVRRLTLRLFFDGEISAELVRYVPLPGRPRGGKLDYNAYVLARVGGRNGLRTEVDVAGGGIIALRFTATADTYFYGGVWECDDSCAVRDVSLGVVMCTFRREKDVLRNAAELAEVCADLKGTDIFIVDNGRTLAESDMPPGVRLIPNRNLGGSGGFARGMLECLDAGKTHFLLMDDDVVFEPDSLRRTRALLSVMRPEFAGCGLGGAMMTFERPDVVFENGAEGGHLTLRFPKHNIDVESPGGLLWCCAFERTVNYAGWWFFAAPVDMIRTHGLNLPLFIKYDDIEYGRRTCGDYSIVYTIGLGIWHEAFDRKMKPYLRYYLMRNSLIYYAITGEHAYRRTVVRATAMCLRDLFRDRKQLDYVYDGVDDYLKGPAFLLKTDGEALNDSLLVGPRKRRSLIAGAFGVIRTFFRMLIKGRRVAEEYRMAREDLTSAESWRERLGLPPAEEERE